MSSTEVEVEGETGVACPTINRRREESQPGIYSVVCTPTANPLFPRLAGHHRPEPHTTRWSPAGWKIHLAYLLGTLGEGFAAPSGARPDPPPHPAASRLICDPRFQRAAKRCSADDSPACKWTPHLAADPGSSSPFVLSLPRRQAPGTPRARRVDQHPESRG